MSAILKTVACVCGMQTIKFSSPLNVYQRSSSLIYQFNWWGNGGFFDGIHKAGLVSERSEQSLIDACQDIRNQYIKTIANGDLKIPISRFSDIGDRYEVEDRVFPPSPSSDTQYPSVYWDWCLAANVGRSCWSIELLASSQLSSMTLTTVLYETKKTFPAIQSAASARRQE